MHIMKTQRDTGAPRSVADDELRFLSNSKMMDSWNSFRARVISEKIIYAGYPL